MLKNAYIILAKIGFDTAENEPAKNLQKTIFKLLSLLLVPKQIAYFVGPCLDHAAEELEVRVAADFSRWPGLLEGQEVDRLLPSRRPVRPLPHVPRVEDAESRPDTDTGYRPDIKSYPTTKIVLIFHGYHFFRNMK